MSRETTERARIEAATTAVCAERGYAGADLAAVLERAGVGEEEFHRHFADLEDCLCAVVQAGTEELLARSAAVFADRQGWRNQLRAFAYVMLDFLCEDPDRARVMVVESPALERAREIRDQGRAALAALIDLGRLEIPDPSSVPPNVAEVTAGAISNRIQIAIEADDFPALETMVPELMYTAVRPYLGLEAALEEIDAPRPV